MAKETKTNEASAEETAAQDGGKSKLRKMLLIGGFVTGAAAVQLIIAMMFLSTFASSAQSDAESLEEQVDEAIEKELVTSNGHGDSMIEVELGEYTVTSFQPSSEITLRIDFHLFGTIAQGDQSEFASRFERNKNRVREQIIVTTRNAELTDLTDPGLGLIKRRVLTKVNRTLGRPLLTTIIIGDFSFIEQ